LGKKVKRPHLVNQEDLIETIWPRKFSFFLSFTFYQIKPLHSIYLDGLKKEKLFPKTQTYCLMSAAKSFTDFHVDFGGSSVFYHIISGEKIFFMIPPTKRNLQLYEYFNNRENRGLEIKSLGQFADLIPIEERYCVRLQAGSTPFSSLLSFQKVQKKKKKKKKKKI